MVPSQPPTDTVRRQGRPRIETQIHRRKKAKAFSALKPEWDEASQVPPSHLRMPSGHMSSILPSKTKKSS